jgi:hypothetical protein
MVTTASILGWCFVILGFCALLFSMCCARFDPTQYEYTEPANANNNPDVENPNVPTPPPYQANAYDNPGNAAAGKPGTYTKDGIPTNDIPAKSGKSSYAPPQAAPSPQEDIPMAYAEEIPQNQHASAPPAEHDDNHPTNTAQDDQRASTGTGGNLGGTAGKKFGKFFTTDEQKQQKLEQTGKKAGETFEKGFLTAKNFIKSKAAKKDDKKDQSGSA